MDWQNKVKETKQHLVNSIDKTQHAIDAHIGEEKLECRYNHLRHEYKEARGKRQ